MTALAATGAENPARTSGLCRFAIFYAVFVLLHIKGGAMVTSTGSGMAFTDWPLARGSLWPPGMDLEDLFEHIHRISGSLVGLFGIVLLWRIYRSDQRVWLKRLAWGLLGMVIVQGILGGLGVVMSDEGESGRTWWPAAVGHGVLAQPTLCVSVLIAYALHPSWNDVVRGPQSAVSGTRKATTIALVLVFLQLILGASFRHTNVTGLLWLHIGMAMVVSVGILVSASIAGARFGEKSRGFRILTRFVFVALLLQLVLGFATLAVRRFKDPSNIEYLGRSLVVSSHVIIGASLFLLATLLVARAWRNLEVEPEAS